MRQVSSKATKFSQDCRHNWSFSELCHGKGMGCAAAHFFGGEEIGGGADLAQIQAEYAHRYLATSFSFSRLILIIRWPAPTWGITNAPPPASKRSLNRLAKKFLNCLSQDRIYHPMPSTLADLLCWRYGERSLQQQAGHGRRISAQNEGKGSG